MIQFQKIIYTFHLSHLLLGSFFCFLISCSTPQKLKPLRQKASVAQKKPLTLKKIINRRTLTLSLGLEKKVSKYLIQEPDQEISIRLYKLINGKEELVSRQEIKGIKIPSVIRLKVKKDKYNMSWRPTYTVIIHLYVNSKDRFRGFLIIPRWKSILDPLPITLEKL